ncbi:dolichyl-phosphate-mannose--protein mannosyltransferase [Quadrisphaera sp. DSM 44207]|uniref:dolichyl-phosphate-mannose--protein mannosyltransferase n=1 Tax=Quadrisphaera sp. DSM 44207 TaxID=1881057 RepID=UPI00088D2A97|nr:phospholipid carrier-dependent glycosyltransferase [Quadrisphaera sp. DSM 44207]SDQ66491.1 Dolichyl-phosphate-mannose-protein mannosyltransferase [Quadrisphaera sp. DSM 44207]
MRAPRARTEHEQAALRERLLGPRRERARGDRLRGWAGPLLVAALAGVLRFWRLGEPHQLVFDETYYVKQAYTLLRVGYELRWPEGADEDFTAGSPDAFLDEADYPVHPPVGKWMIAVGQALFGVESSVGWRFSSAVVGTVMVLVVARIGRRLLGSTLLGCTAGLLLAVDGLHLVHSRTGLLDLFLTLWVLLAFGALLLDREASREQLVRRLCGAGPSSWGARLRPWRWAAAVCLGLACGVKWSGLYFVAAFGLLTVLWDVGARRAARLPRWGQGLLRDGAPAAAVVLPTVVVVYVATWAGWFASDDAHLRRWAQENPGEGVTWLPPALRSLWRYHQDMWAFHTGLTSPHDYESHPWSWIVQGRPTSFFYEGSVLGDPGCAVEQCSRAITSLGNPVVWWAGALALPVLVLSWALRRDWRAGAVLAGVAAGWLPWFLYAERTIFTFYAVAFLPFLVLGLAHALGLVLGPPDAAPARRRTGAALAGAVVIGAVVAAAYFWPVWTGEVIPYAQWRARMWLPSWI